MKRSLVLLLVFVSFALSLAGCKYLPAKTIDNPSEGSPEYLVYKAIQATQAADVEAGWKILRPLLHSRVVESRVSEESFLNNNFPAFRRKAYLFTPTDGNPTYKLDRTDEDEDDKRLRLFVVNEGSDMPSPFRIERDPAANNEWRIVNVP